MLKYLHSIIAIPLIYLYTMVMATLSLTFSLFDRTGELQHWCSRVWCKLIAATVGMKVIIHGAENLKLRHAAIVMSNHQSYMDIPTLFANLPFQFRIFAKRPLFYIPFMGWHLWRSGHIPVDRGNHASTTKTLNLAIEKLKAGIPVLIFPEGTRGEEYQKVKRLKAGAFKLAQMTNAPILPITIVGTALVLKPRSLLFNPGTVHMFVDPPIYLKENDQERDLAEVMTDIENQMNDHLASIFGKPANDQSSTVPVSILR